MKVDKIYRIVCDRCKIVVNQEEGESYPFINKATLASLNVKGEEMKEFEGLVNFICDDCWNDYIKFIKLEEGD